jgi:hypothetical protein
MQRGRKSLAALAVKPIAGPNDRHPEPPARLNVDEAGIWREICASMPVGWFPVECQGVLEALVTETAARRRFDESVRNFPSDQMRTADGLHALRQLRRMQAEAGKAIAYLATKLRLTPQSRYNATRANTLTQNGQAVIEPWQIGA